MEDVQLKQKLTFCEGNGSTEIIEEKPITSKISVSVACVRSGFFQFNRKCQLLAPLNASVVIFAVRIADLTPLKHVVK